MLQEVRASLWPVSFPVYASIVSFGFRLLYNCNTRYEWLVRPYSPGTSTMEEAPSFAWRTNGLRYRQGRDLAEKSLSAEPAVWDRLPESAGKAPHLSSGPHQDGGPSFFPKETPQRRWIDKVYSEMAGLEAVQSIGDTHSRSPAVHLGRRSN